MPTDPTALRRRLEAVQRDASANPVWAVRELADIVLEMLPGEPSLKATSFDSNTVATWLREAATAEREACAVLMDSLRDQAATDLQAVRACAFGYAAQAIRARS